MVNVGLVGTGFVARRRADALQADRRSRLLAVTGHNPADTTAFAQAYGITPIHHWSDLVADPAIDLVIICHVNRDHGTVALAALAAQKHVVVEYPLALEVTLGEQILALSKKQGRLLHVEHIELLGSTHRALKANLPAIGTPTYARYATLSPQRPATKKWTYCPELFGFPLVGALSRIHRLVDSLGPVARVFGQNRYDGLYQGDDGLERYATGLCTAQLTFTCGAIGEVIYAKGEGLWSPTRRLEIYGRGGQITLDGNQGERIDAQGHHPIALTSRQGLFAADTTMVLDQLLEGKPLYVSPEASLYALRVAAAVQESAATGQAVAVE